MKRLCLLFALMGTAASAEILTIPDIKVSITDQSAAAAREKAIAQAHRLAFQRALDMLEEGPTPQTMPSDEEIMRLANGFSVDREKNTTTSYAASMTFQFDKETLNNWVYGLQNVPSSEGTFGEFTSPQEGVPLHVGDINAPERYMIVRVSLASLGELVAIESVFESLPHVRAANLKSLTEKKADFELRVAGEFSQLNLVLAEKGWRLNERDGYFTLKPNFQSHSNGWFE